MLDVGVCCAILSVPCSLEVTCWERADLLAVVCVVTFQNVPCRSTLELRVRLALPNCFKSSSKIFLLTVSRQYFFCRSFCYLCLVFVMFASVHCCFVVTCWERPDLLALVCDV